MRPRLVKDAGIDQSDGEILGAMTWDMPGRPAMHGHSTTWDLAKADGALFRSGEKPRRPPRPARGPGRQR